MKRLASLLLILIVALGSVPIAMAEGAFVASSDALTGDELYAAALLYRAEGDFDTAVKFMSEAYARGTVNALVEVAAWYFCDKVTLEPGQDTNEIALYLLNLATEQDNAMAYYYWGLIYSGKSFPAVGGPVSEDIIPYDIEKAIWYYEKSNELGYGKAYKFLGDMYYKGDYGMEQDFEAAAAYYKQGADNLDFTCSHLYADCLYEGIGVEQDVNEAIRLYQWLVDVKAHNKNDYAWGAYMLGKIYDEGVYVEKDEALSLSYYELAVELGSKDAKAALGIVE